MRISTQEGDPGFRPDAGEWVVLLNGEPQSALQSGRAVITADEERGAIWYHPCADDGGLLMWGAFGSPPVEMIEGKVSLYHIRSEYLPRR